MNTTPFTADVYNKGIRELIPHYDIIIQEVINWIQVTKPICRNRLDAGCGTGYLIDQVRKNFSESNFYMCDPASDMIAVAKDVLRTLSSDQCHFIQSTTQDLDVRSLPKMDIITAILTHHFCTKEERVKATKKIYDLLEDGGIYFTVEIFRPRSQETTDLALKKWGQWESNNGRSEQSITEHLARYGTKYFPITIDEHYKLLADSGFNVYDIFRLSNTQIGIYAIK